MKTVFNSLRAMLGLVALIALALGLVWLLGTAKEGIWVGQQVSPIETPTQPRPTPMPGPTARLTPTIPPVPTSLPTPVVTPIPVAAPPFIPGTEDKPTQPYKIVVRRENTLWVVNNDGTDRRLLIDTESQAGLYLRIIPWEDAEFVGKWSVSPDSARLALTVFARERMEYKGQRNPANIYILDVATGDLRFLVEGETPVWSPDSSRIAYVREGGLWVVDTATGKEGAIFSVEEEYAVEDLAWSPDEKKIAFSHGIASLGRTPEMLVADVEGSSVVQLIPRTDYYAFGSLSWSPGGEHISYVSHVGKHTGPLLSPNLWMTTSDGTEQTQLTKDMLASGVPRWSPDGRWIAFVGTQHYAEPEPFYCLWLVRVDGSGLRRLTRDPISHPYWSPDGTQSIFQRAEQGIWTINLSDGNLKQVYPGEPGVFYHDMAILGRSKYGAGTDCEIRAAQGGIAAFNHPNRLASPTPPAPRKNCCGRASAFDIL